MSDKFDRNGKPIDLMEWAKLMENREYKRVAWTELPDGKAVSTVWLGLDHSFGGPRPIIFETIVFGSKAMGNELDGKRYSTEEEALAGHAAMVENWSDPHPQPTQPEGDA